MKQSKLLTSVNVWSGPPATPPGARYRRAAGGHVGRRRHHRHGRPHRFRPPARQGHTNNITTTGRRNRAPPPERSRPLDGQTPSHVALLCSTTGATGRAGRLLVIRYQQSPAADRSAARTPTARTRPGVTASALFTPPRHPPKHPMCHRARPARGPSFATLSYRSDPESSSGHPNPLRAGTPPPDPDRARQTRSARASRDPDRSSHPGTPDRPRTTAKAPQTNTCLSEMGCLCKYRLDKICGWCRRPPQPG